MNMYSYLYASPTQNAVFGPYSVFTTLEGFHHRRMTRALPSFEPCKATQYCISP